MEPSKTLLCDRWTPWKLIADQIKIISNFGLKVFIQDNTIPNNIAYNIFPVILLIVWIIRENKDVQKWVIVAYFTLSVAHKNDLSC